MLRRSPLKRSGFKSKHEPAVSREDRPMALLTPSSRRGNYGGTTAGAVLKERPGRNPVLLEMARGRRCLLLAVGNCRTLDGSTTVACHQNEGKGMAIKQADERSVWGCAACHEWLDRSGSPRAEKRRAFDAAHARQRVEWARVAADPGEPERFRRAAQWALDQLEAKG